LISSASRILVIDGDAVVRRLLPYAIKSRLPVEIDCVATPQEGLDQINPGYDLIIADLQETRHMEAEIVKQLQEKAPETPVVLMSTNDPSLVSKLPTMRLVHWIPKPFDRDTFVNTLRQLLRGRHQATSLSRRRDPRLL
jgi:DNA-binding NtrC family response regulator